MDFAAGRARAVVRASRSDQPVAARFSGRLDRDLFRSAARPGSSSATASDLGLAAALLGAAKTLAAGALALAILAGLAWLSARTTLYVVTTRRLVMKVGIALPIFYNVPFTQIGAATLRLHADGTGDLPVSLTDGQRIAYLTLWPSARPFRFTRPEPALRCIGDANAVARPSGGASRDAAEAAEVRRARDGAAALLLHARPLRPEGRQVSATVRARPGADIPLPVLIAAATLIAVTIAGCVLTRVSGVGVRLVETRPVQTLSLSFEDRDDGAVSVRDAADGGLSM